MNAAVGRAHLKTGLALVLGATRTDRLIRFMSGSRRLPLIVGYHRVVDDGRLRRASIIAPMLVSRRMFERQLDWIGRRFRFVSLDEVGSRLESGRAFPTPTATITFDDGYRDMYEHAYPVLKRKGIPAAVFMVTDWIDRTTPLYHDRLYLLLTRDWCVAREVLVDLGVVMAEQVTPSRAVSEPFLALRFLLTNLCQEELGQVVAALEERLAIDTEKLHGLKPLTWAMLTEMQRGGITVGSHTRTHALLTRESSARMLEELAGARHTLEDRLHTPIKHFAYPDGAFNAEAVEAVAQAGYRFAYTTCHHRDRRHPLLTIPRCVLWENSCLDPAGRFSPAVASCVTSGVFHFASGCRHRHAVTSVPAVSLVRD
jgi:peptidoglycan/xylan/chitin deacetylase (PgdA/CDA1 family)